MGRARKRLKLEEGEISSSDDDCIIVDVQVKKGRESKLKVAQGHGHHLSTSKANTAPPPIPFAANAADTSKAMQKKSDTTPNGITATYVSHATKVSQQSQSYSNTKLPTQRLRFAASAATKDSKPIQE
ncbi:uncharacterized protein LW93_4626 [Fusarium fujikuroi]|nr:uncharacterized protein LW93_4626 [Fusarium fujikuroi]